MRSPKQGGRRAPDTVPRHTRLRRAADLALDNLFIDPTVSRAVTQESLLDLIANCERKIIRLNQDDQREREVKMRLDSARISVHT